MSKGLHTREELSDLDGMAMARPIKGTRCRNCHALRAAVTAACSCALVGSALLVAVSARNGGTTSDGPPYQRPPGLIQAGDSKSTCIVGPYNSYDVAGSLKLIERYTHVHYNCIVTYSNADTTWAQWVSPWLTSPQTDFPRWLAAGRRARTIVITQNLVPDQVDHQAGWEETCASGAFRRYGASLAEHLVRAGFGYSVVRLGPEMNGTWYYDSLGQGPASWRAWASCFAQTVEAMRSVPHEHFLFDWNVNAGYRVIPLADFYPGDNYVDVIGIDAYDEAPHGGLPPVEAPSRWQALVSELLGLEDVYRFAQAHGKPLSIPEWGTVSGPNGGDDANYVQHMGQFVASHNVSYQAWYDGGSGVLSLTPTSAPLSLAAYVQEFGPGSYLARYQGGQGS
jgi:hypothetical protein